MLCASDPTFLYPGRHFLYLISIKDNLDRPIFKIVSFYWTACSQARPSQARRVRNEKPLPNKAHDFIKELNMIQ